MEGYYRLHAKIYDATRWSFLFGRHEIIRLTASEPERILEIGCGTGINLAMLAKRYPQAAIVGVDVAEPMLQVARKRLAVFGDRIELRHQPYQGDAGNGATFDLILASYCLSMINPGWEQVVEAAAEELADSGVLAVVDFHDSSFPWFKRWMGLNHVRMDGHLLPVILRHTSPSAQRVVKAYGGVWHYLLYVGGRPPENESRAV